MGRLSAAQSVIAEKVVCVLLVRGEAPDGGACYAYVAIRADRLDELIAAQKGTFHPEDFGVVLASGPGDPPPEVRDRMTTEYGFNHEAMVDLPDEERSNQLVRDLGKMVRPG